MPYFNPPKAAFSNPPIEPQNFAPDAFVIANITLGPTTIVTTRTTFYGSVNNYVVGQLVRFVIPRFYGAQLLNNMLGTVINILGVNQFSLNIDSTHYDAFIPTPLYGPTLPQVVAIGDVNTGVTNIGRSNQGIFIPGSFVNIS